MIDAYLRSAAELDDRTIHLLFSANRWELALRLSISIHRPSRFAYLFQPPPHRSTIEQLLSTGTIVLCDRYAFSGVAFSTAKGLPYAWCRAPDVSLPAPDLTLFLDIPPEKAKERGGYGEERYEQEEMQTRVRGVFDRIGLEMEDRSWIRVDAGLERDEVEDIVWGHIGSFINGVDGSTRRLWEDCR
jgi:dTMP kinase